MRANGDKRVDTARVNLDGDGAPGVKLVTKRNSPWSHAEHLLYLLGLERHGRGAWRAIADNFCISRTPTQVASHAQKYFARQALTPAQRHKTRASIHDITCDTILPLATAPHRDSIRQTLQRIVSEGKDLVSSGDSATDSSATSSNRSAPAKCLPVQDPIFRQVFAFTTEAMWPGSTSHGIVFHSSPQPLLCAATPPALQQPAHGNAAAHSNASARGSASAHGNAIAHGNAAATPHGSFWAGPPPAGPITPPAHAYVHSGPGMPPQPFPVVFATAGDQMHGNHQQPQMWYFMPSQGPGMHMWPHHFVMQGPATEVHGPAPAPTGAFHALSSSETHVSTPEQAALIHAPTEAAATAGYVYQPAAGFAGDTVAPWQEGRRAGVSEASLSSPPLLPQPAGHCEHPQMWNAQLQGISPDNVRGTKRDSFEGVDQSQLSNVYVASSLSSKVAKGTKTPSRAAAPGMYMSPQPHPGLRFPHSPPQPGLRLAHPLPPGSAPGLAPSATPPGPVPTSLPVNAPPRRTMYFTSACMQPASMPLTVAVPQYVLPHHSMRPGNVLRPRGGGRASGRRDQAASRPHAAMHAAVAWPGPPPISTAPTPWLELSSARPPAHPQDPPPCVLTRRISQGVRPSPHAAAHAVDGPAPPASPRGAHSLPDAATQTNPTRAVPNAAAYSLPAPPPPPQPPNHNTVVPLAPLEGQVPPDAFTADVYAQGSSCGAPDQLLGEEPLLPSTVPGQGVEEAPPQDLAEMDDFMGYLLGTSGGPGDGACIGTNSWDKSRSRSGARASGSGSGSGGNGSGMGGSDGVNSCHGPGCMPRAELP